MWFFFPWQLDPDHETQDSAYQMIPELFKIKSLTVTILIKTGIPGVLNLSEAKLLVPFFGGADDRKAIEIALSFGFQTYIRYYKTDKEPEDEDTKLLEYLMAFAEKDPSLIYSSREYTEGIDNITELLKEEYESNQFSLISVGYDSAYPTPGSSDFNSETIEPMVGVLAGKLIDADFPTNILVVKSGVNSSEMKDEKQPNKTETKESNRSVPLP